MEWFVYIVQSRLNHYYTGISPNPEERVKKHNLGKGSRFAREQKPVTLVYTSKPYSNKSEARKREIQIKHWTRAKKENLITGDWQ